MKRKFLSIISFVLALTMILPMSIFVSAEDEPTPNDPLKIFYNGEEKTNLDLYFTDGQTFTLTAFGGDGNYGWGSSNNSVATVNNGVVAPQKNGTVTITLSDSSNASSVTCTITFTKILCTGISITTPPTKLSYISGESINTTGMVVTASYNNNTKSELKSGYTVVPSGALTVRDTSFYVTLGDNLTSNSIAITVSEKTVSTVTFANPTTKFTEGDTVPEFEVLVTYNDGSTVGLYSGYDVYVNDTKVSAGYTFKTTDKNVKVMFGGVYSNVLPITVSTKQETAKSVTLSMTKAPTKTEYKVGDTFNPSDMTVKVVIDNYEMKQGEVTVTPSSSYKITEDDLKNKTYITITATVIDKRTGGKTYSNVPLTVTGLTIKEAVEALVIYEVTGVVMEKSSYPVGYKIDLDDIDYITYRESRTYSTTKRLDGYTLNLYYDDEFSIEVVDESGDTKSRRETTIEEDDVYDYKSSSTSTVPCVNLMLTADNASKKEYTFRVKVGGSGVSYYYDDDLIAVYDDIDDALTYTMEQDDDVEDDFELDVDVKDSKSITLKLQEDQKISKSFDLELCHNVVIDLNGHTLTFYTNTVDITKS
ncbi:MAG: hypothetical protein ACI4XJ_02095, partial [Eubacteriales bacterium]